MTIRTQLNAYHAQQAVKSAAYLAHEEKAAFVQECEARHAFEQALLTDPPLQKSPKIRPLVASGLALLLLLSGVFYWQTGRWTQVVDGEQAFNAFQQQRAEEDSQQRNDHYLTHLQNQLRQNPNNGDLWFELGQAYALNNDFNAALISYRNALQLLGNRASLMGAMATADYYLHRQTLTEQGKAWITQALEIDPQESASLLLLASDAFLHNDPATAIRYWEQVLEHDNPAIDRRAIIKSMAVAEQLRRAKPF